MARKRLSALLLFFLVLSLASAEEGILVEWEGSPDHTYLIEIEKNGIPLFTRRLADPRVSLDLSPGLYTYRITFLNKFDKADSMTDWIDLTVLKDLVPVIIDVPEHTIFAGDRAQKLIIHTADIMEGAVMQLERDGAVDILAYGTRGPNTVELTLETGQLEPGYYGLRIINPSGSEAARENCIRLRKKANPRVSEMSPHTAFTGDQIPRITVKGGDMDRDVVAFLERDGRRHRLPVREFVNGNEIILWGNLKDLRPGIYDLVLINPPLEETIVADAFSIIDPGKVRDESFYGEIPWGTDILIGLPLPDVLLEQTVFNYTFTPEDGLFNPFPEVELVLRSDLSAGKGGLEHFGWVGRLAFVPPVEEGVLFTTVNMGLYGRTRFTYPVNLFAEALMGFRWMDMGVGSENIREEGTLLTYGGGLVVNYDRFLVEMSGRKDAWIMENSQVDIYQVTLRLGYRF